MAERELIYSTISSIHGSYVLDQLLVQYNDGRNCDLEVRLKTKRCLYVHKCLVDIFMAEVGAELENDRFYLDLGKYEENVIVPLIDMMYTGELRVQMDQVDQVCEAAVYVGYSQAEKGCHFYTSSFPKRKESSIAPAPGPKPIVKQEPIEALFTQAPSSISNLRPANRSATNTAISSALNVPNVAVTNTLNPTPLLGNNVRVITIPAGRGAPVSVGARIPNPALKQMPLSSFLIRGNAGVPLVVPAGNAVPIMVPGRTVQNPAGSLANLQTGSLANLQTVGSLGNLQNASIITSGQRHFVSLIPAPMGISSAPRGSVAGTTVDSSKTIVTVNNAVADLVRDRNNITIVNGNAAATRVVTGRSVKPSQAAEKGGKKTEDILELAGAYARRMKQFSVDGARKLIRGNSSGNNNSGTTDKELGKGDADSSRNKTNRAPTKSNVPLKPCSVALEKIPANTSKSRGKRGKGKKWDSDEDDEYIGENNSESEALDRLASRSNTNRRSTRQKKVVNYNQIEETYKDLDEDLSDVSIDDSPMQITSNDSDCSKNISSTDFPSSFHLQRKRSAEGKKEIRKHKKRSEIHKIAQDIADIRDGRKEIPSKSKRRSENHVEAPPISESSEGNTETSSKCRRRSVNRNDAQNLSQTDKPSSQQLNVNANKFENSITKATPIAKLPSKHPQSRPGDGTTVFLCHPIGPVMKP